eukprot:108723-Pyramimonas_sp.AAC.1
MISELYRPPRTAPAANGVGFFFSLRIPYSRRRSVPLTRPPPMSSSRSLQGKTPPQIVAEVQDTWYKALSAGWKLWPFVHMVTFSPLIQPDLKLLFVGASCALIDKQQRLLSLRTTSGGTLRSGWVQYRPLSPGLGTYVIVPTLR